MKNHLVLIILLALVTTVVFTGCTKNNDDSVEQAMAPAVIPAAAPVPELTTAAVINITQTAAACGGTITKANANIVTMRGVCWSTHALPTTADNYSISSASTILFSSPLTGLVNKVTYYVRAFATNSFGTGYGDEVSFTAIVIGDAYQGGKVAYILQPGDLGYQKDVPHGLIAAAADKTGLSWGVAGATGAVGTTRGTGNSNTLAIVNKQGAGAYAAKYCADLVLGGYDDWYLPSVDELKIIMSNPIAIGGIPIDGLNLYYYWTSTESTSNSAMAYITLVDRVEPTDKAIQCRVRAMRSF